MSLHQRSIDSATLEAVLSRYNSHIHQTSDAKQKKKPGDTADKNDSLAVLDEWRLSSLPSILNDRRSDKGGDHLQKGEVERLIRWKLMHGTFRPSLMKLVSSNEETKLEDVTFRAFHVVTSRRDSERETLFTKILEAISILTELRGIGPASASLLLSVRFPEHVPFFSDEAYRWLTAEAGNPWTASIKYNAKEYASMLGSCLDLATRLGVHAVDIERAGWVLGREKADLSGSTSTSRTGSKRKEEHAGLDESASSDTGVAPHKRSKKR